MTDQITLEKALQLVSYVQDDAGKWHVGDVVGDVHGDVCGDVFVDVRGDVFGDVRGDVCGDVCGDVFGDVRGDVEGNVLGRISDKTNPMIDPQELRAIVAAWWEDTFVNDYVIDRSGNYCNAEDCIEDIVIRARAARRPKPKSLAEEALKEIDAFEGMGTCDLGIIRRALEQLQELEGQQ